LKSLNFNNITHFQTGSGAHSASVQWAQEAGSKAALAWNWPFISNYCRG